MDTFEIVDYEFGRELRLTTPGVYSEDAAVAILQFIETQMGGDVKNTGWKQGYSPVGAGVPIHLDDVEAYLVTDGSDIVIRRVSGSKTAFDALCTAIRNSQIQES